MEKFDLSTEREKAIREEEQQTIEAIRQEERLRAQARWEAEGWRNVIWTAALSAVGSAIGGMFARWLFNRR